MELKTASFWRDRLKASAIHLILSLVIAAIAAALVFGLWYPYPYRELSGGRELFFIVVTVDVILGPLITLAVFDRSKTRTMLQRDLAVVVLLQLAALVYGLWTVSMARPVHLVFEVDRFSVVHAVDVPPELLTKVPVGINALPMTGPTLLALRKFKDNEEKTQATFAALQGEVLSARPDFWQPYANAIPEVLKAAHPVRQLKNRFPDRATEINRILSTCGCDSDRLVYLPLVGRAAYWTIFLDPLTAQPVGAMPLDPF